jgi:hypothetical protein
VTKKYSLHAYHCSDFEKDNVLAARTAAKIKYVLYNLQLLFSGAYPFVQSPGLDLHCRLYLEGMSRGSACALQIAAR